VNADWTRVNYYKPRIRVLGQTVFDEGTVWHDVCAQTLRELSFYQASTLLLPNLRILNFCMLPPDAIPFARLFFGPQVSEVTIPIISEHAESSVELLSSLIPHFSPDIHRLDILSITSLTKPCSAIFPLIQGLHNLHALNIDVKHRGLHERVTAQLGGLSALGSLKMSLIPNNQIHFYTTALGQFPVLTEFCFAVECWVSAAMIMDSMHCRFTDLAVTTHNEGSLADLRTFTESISKHPSLSSLTHLSLTDFEIPLSHADDETYVENVFRPLFALVGLKYVNLQIDVSARLRDSWYNDAAPSWPSLESICISSPNTGITLKPQMTLAGLIPLAKHCTKLQFVRLRLDAQPFDFTRINCDEFSNTSIEKLCLETYIIPSPRKVFHSLTRIFPNLEYVYQASRLIATRSISWPWDEVNKMLHASAVGRRGPCVNAQARCTCGTTDSRAGPIKTRPQTPGAVQLRAVMDSLRSRS
jgi:hypothetical protein